MKYVSFRKMTGLTAGMMALLFLGSCASARTHAVHPYRYSDVDMPVSLALGTVRTPEFPVKQEAYFIMLLAHKGHLPFRDMQCMMGLLSDPLAKTECREEPLLQANWTVRDGERVAAQGTSPIEDHAGYTDEYLYKVLGQFTGKAGQTYAVEASFTRDGTPLNVANPHLIVIRVKYH